MTPALLLVALFSVAPAVQPPITVGVTDTNCGEVTINVLAPAGTQANGWGDTIGSQPPWIHGASDRPVTLVVRRDPGTRIEWGIGLHGGSTPVITGVHVVPPCLAPALEPIVPPQTSSVAITRTRYDLWDWVLRRFGGAR